MAKRRMLVLGGSLHHRGGLEGFCERASEAVNAAADGWVAEWQPTDTAYLTPKLLPRAAGRLKQLLGARRAGVDLIWLQWSTLADLVFLLEARALGVPVMVTPHLGANARLQRVPMLRRLCLALLSRANRIAMLFDGQQDEIALPDGVPRSTIRTFLPPATLATPVPARAGTILRIIHAGRLSEGKGTFRTVELCAALRALGVQVSAQIIGRADEQSMGKLRAMIAAEQLDEAVTLVDWMAETDLVRSLGEADVLAHLSTLDSFPLIVMEALAMGAVPVVGEMAGARSMVSRYGGHVARGSSAADAADWLAARPIASIRAAGREAAERVRADHRWAACAEQAIAAAEATLAAAGRPA